MKNLVLTLAALSVAGVSSAATFLGPTPYLQASDSPWAGGSFDYFHLDDVEDHAINTPGATLTAGIVTSTSFGLSSIVDSVDEDDGSINGTNGFNGVFGDSLFGSQIEITFDANVLGNLPTHAGIVWTDGGSQVTFEAFDANGVSLGTQTGSHSDGGISGGTAEDRFYGVEHQGGISKIRIGSGSTEADHVQYGYAPVPEPATMTLIGLGALAALRKRKAK